MAQFLVKAIVYLVMLCLSWYGMSAVNYESILKKNHVGQAQLLYFLLVMSLAYLSGSFLLALIYRS
ncbi:MAG: DUF1146 domain-containing protein [Solobacterium sp.]|nr:DUF1146 domain-containing protein [Solobacterium sp.]